MDKDHKARIIENFIKSDWWKILSSEIVKMVERFDKKLTREWMREEDMLNDKNNLPIYTKYDLYALTRNTLQEIIKTPEKIIKEWELPIVTRDFREQQL